jgi:hypothetical protein
MGTNRAVLLQLADKKRLVKSNSSWLDNNIVSVIAGDYMYICLNEINWESIAAIATFIAVIVALIPIWREAHRQKAYAKNLRFRLCSKLIFLRPSLSNVAIDGYAKHPSAVLSKEDFREVVDSIGAMLKESSVLKAGEQDCIGIVFLNLQMASGVYMTADMTIKSAEQILALINRAIALMEKWGLLHHESEVPWNNGSDQNSA